MTLFRPNRTIRATTQNEIDAALNTADQVIVEGDDRLLSYAIAKASKDSENVVSIDLSNLGEVKESFERRLDLRIILPNKQDQSVPFETEPEAEQPEFGGPPRPRPEPAVMGGFSAGLRLRPLKILIYVILFGGAITWIMWLLWAIRIEGVIIDAPTKVPSDGGTPAVLQASLAWPAVAIVAIIALFLIARQAIAGVLLQRLTVGRGSSSRG